jgi:hypothetical protein
MYPNRKIIKHSWLLALLLFLTSGILKSQTGDKFERADTSSRFFAVGPSKPVVKLLDNVSSPVPDELKNVAVEVFFDLLQVKMQFSLPCYPCMVTENNIHFSNGWTETYDPKASSSCEVLWDRDSKYARMWIECQNPARIIVRVRAALADPDGYIAHSYIPSGSPYGKGDWTDEWYYIYPDGIYTRYVRIYTGLADQSLVVTDETFHGVPPVREIPPNVVHEFQEDFIFGIEGHLPKDDIETSPVTLIRLNGDKKTYSYKPYPKNFNEYLNAPIKLINLKSKFRPFTISLPYGLENEPYSPEGKLPYIFQTWLKNPKDNGYSVSLGHSLNWWHYKRTDKILEQVYLSGMIEATEPAIELITLAKSWLTYPRLKIDHHEFSYTNPTYDLVQRAYIITKAENVPGKIDFSLGGYISANGESSFPVNILNPVFIVKDWGTAKVIVYVNKISLEEGTDYRAGYEKGDSGIDLVIWLRYKSSEETFFEIIPRDE